MYGAIWSLDFIVIQGNFMSILLLTEGLPLLAKLILDDKPNLVSI